MKKITFIIVLAIFLGPQLVSACTPYFGDEWHEIKEIKSNGILPEGVSIIEEDNQISLVNETADPIYIIDSDYKERLVDWEEYLEYSELPNDLVSRDKIVEGKNYFKTNTWAGDTFPVWRENNRNGTDLAQYFSYDSIHGNDRPENIPTLEPKNFSVDVFYKEELRSLEFTAYFQLNDEYVIDAGWDGTGPDPCSFVFNTVTPLDNSDVALNDDSNHTGEVNDEMGNLTEEAVETIETQQEAPQENLSFFKKIKNFFKRIFGSR